RAPAPLRPARTAPRGRASRSPGTSRGTEDDREERRAEEGGDYADRQLRRREDGPRDDIRQDEEARAGEQRERYDRAVARRHEQPDRVRDDDPDECDQPADGHR